MPIDTSSFIEFSSDTRYDILKRPVKVDKDNKAYEIQFLPPATGIKTYTKTESTVSLNTDCYNASGSLQYIDVYCGSDYKANMQGTFIVLEYQCVQQRTYTTGTGEQGDPHVDHPFKGTPIAPTVLNNNGAGWSMPWNTLTFFNTASLKINQSQKPIEQYINSGVIDYITTARILKKYKNDALENNDMTFNTPCIEEKFDNSTISKQSALRAINWMGANGVYGDGSADSTDITRQIITYQKVIPLSDLFESCENPGIWTNTNRFRFEYTLKAPDAIAFNCGVDLEATKSSPVYVFVTKIGLIFDSSRMQAMQAVESATEKQAGKVENIHYLENSCLPVQYQSGQQLVATGQRDVQELILGFPAKGATVGSAIKKWTDVSVAVNPIQFYCGNISSLSYSYGVDTPIKTPLTLAGTISGYNKTTRNATAYALYRKSCGADRASVVPIAVDFEHYEMYHLYFLPIFNPILPHKTDDPKDLRVNTTGGTTGDAVMIIRSFAGAQVSSSGFVEVF